MPITFILPLLPTMRTRCIPFTSGPNDTIHNISPFVGARHDLHDCSVGSIRIPSRPVMPSRAAVIVAIACVFSAETIGHKGRRTDLHAAGMPPLSLYRCVFRTSNQWCLYIGDIEVVRSHDAMSSPSPTALSRRLGVHWRYRFVVPEGAGDHYSLYSWSGHRWLHRVNLCLPRLAPHRTVALYSSCGGGSGLILSTDIEYHALER